MGGQPVTISRLNAGQHRLMASDAHHPGSGDEGNSGHPRRRCPSLTAMTETAGPGAAPEPSGWVKSWRWLESLDLTKPPAPVLRWLGILLIAIGYAAAGAPAQLGDWLGLVILAGALILPDIAGFAIGGFRLDLKHAQDEIATLRQEVNAQARASSIAGVAIGNDAIAAWTDALIRAARQANSDQASGAATPWPPPGSGRRAQQSTASPDRT